MGLLWSQDVSQNSRINVYNVWIFVGALVSTHWATVSTLPCRDAIDRVTSEFNRSESGKGLFHGLLVRLPKSILALLAFRPRLPLLTVAALFTRAITGFQAFSTRLLRLLTRSAFAAKLVGFSIMVVVAPGPLAAFVRPACAAEFAL